MLVIVLFINGILWMFMSLRVVKLKFIYNMNRILDVIVCYYEFKIYENVFLFFERIVM